MFFIPFSYNICSRTSFIIAYKPSQIVLLVNLKVVVLFGKAGSAVGMADGLPFSVNN